MAESNETPSTGSKKVNSVGNPNVPNPPQLAHPSDSEVPEQLSRKPEGDEASDAVKVEGLMDTSDSPMK